MIYVHIASANRSGASLLARLFDGHPDVASYPVEFNFPWNSGIYPFLDRLTGSPSHIPDFDPKRDRDILKFLNTPVKRPAVQHRWGLEQADPVGVRKNYLGREFYQSVKTDFDYEKFVRRLRELGQGAQTLEEVYRARHQAYFEAWEDGKYSGAMKFIVTYGSGELYISNMEKYFQEFGSAFILCPIRDALGYIASEKTRLARRYYGSRRFPIVKMPNFFVKSFRHYSLEAMIRSWLVTVTRTVLLQERFGVSGPFIAYRYENLLDDVEGTMKAFCQAIGLDYDPSLLKPTIAYRDWGGSSHQGRQHGVNPRLAHYYPEVLTRDEMDRVEDACGKVASYLKTLKSTPADLRELPRRHLYDYAFQKKYFDDEEKIALYSALAFRDRRSISVGPPGFSAIPALIYARLVHLVHIPRLLRMRYFPGTGRQNYT